MTRRRQVEMTVARSARGDVGTRGNPRRSGGLRVSVVHTLRLGGDQEPADAVVFGVDPPDLASDPDDDPEPLEDPVDEPPDEPDEPPDDPLDESPPPDDDSFATPLSAGFLSPGAESDLRESVR
jgi:hypothetical protein